MARRSAADRRALLDRTSQAEGIAWTTWWRSELGRQRRPVTGGWPGTLSEARVRMARRIATELGVEFDASREELENAARAAYGTARHEWNASCDSDVVEPDEELG